MAMTAAMMEKSANWPVERRSCRVWLVPDWAAQAWRGGRDGGDGRDDGGECGRAGREEIGRVVARARLGVEGVDRGSIEQRGGWPGGPWRQRKADRDERDQGRRDIGRRRGSVPHADA